MIITTVTPKVWKDKQFVELTIAGKTYSCWQTSLIGTLKVGDDIKGEITEKPGQTAKFNIKSINGKDIESKAPWQGKGGGGRGGDPKSFACSYAKDIAIACIEKGLMTQSKEFDSILEHYYNWFMKKMTEA